MIPLPVAPLRDVSVLVTRPIAEAELLARRIESAGGAAIIFPALAIEPIAIEQQARNYDWLIFTSVNAVRYGASHVVHDERTRVGAIGKTTAAALNASSIRVDAMPEQAFTSETLLSNPALIDVAGQSVLIVKGAGGRDVLQNTLRERGAQVAALDVYRRVKPTIDESARLAIEERWREGIDIVTLLSVETLDNLHDLLRDTARVLMDTTPFVTVSDRIVDAARERGLRGEYVLAKSADDDAIVGAIAAWHARAR